MLVGAITKKFSYYYYYCYCFHLLLQTVVRGERCAQVRDAEAKARGDLQPFTSSGGAGSQAPVPARSVQAPAFLQMGAAAPASGGPGDMATTFMMAL